MENQNQNQVQLAKELLDRVIKALVAENGLHRDDSMRIKRIIGEAAETLRENFKEVDVIVKSQTNDAVVDLHYNTLLQGIISVLQFEDIVSQIIGHQLERAEITMTMLLQIEQKICEAEGVEDYTETLQGLRDQLDVLLEKLSTGDSVKQQNLSVGEAELF